MEIIRTVIDFINSCIERLASLLFGEKKRDKKSNERNSYSKKDKNKKKR